jgi:hypothetical protein
MGDQLQRIVVASLFLVATGQPPSMAAPNFHLYCNTGYNESDCKLQLRRLGDVLAKMDLTELGDWSWILVRSQDWRPILRRVGRDPDSPAFTILEKRQTFLEEAVFNSDPVRSRTLLEKWRIPLDQFPKYAVVHELGHALCREADEQRARVYAVELQKTGRVTCRGRNDP